jgi:hypothetical protein
MWLPAWWAKEDRRLGDLNTVGIGVPKDENKTWAEDNGKFAVPTARGNHPIIGQAILMVPVVGPRGVLIRAIEDYRNAGLSLNSLAKEDMLALYNTDRAGRNSFSNIGKLLRVDEVDGTVLCSACKPFHTLDGHIVPPGTSQTVVRVSNNVIRTELELLCKRCLETCNQVLLIETYQ